jgi:hypothetical protein
MKDENEKYLKDIWKLQQKVNELPPNTLNMQKTLRYCIIQYLQSLLAVSEIDSMCQFPEIGIVNSSELESSAKPPKQIHKCSHDNSRDIIPKLDLDLTVS